MKWNETNCTANGDECERKCHTNFYTYIFSLTKCINICNSMYKYFIERV